MVGDTRQGWAIFAAFSVMFLIGVFVCYHFEQAGNPILAKLGIQTAATRGQSGGNMEGKETRFGIANSALFATVTTDASCGAVNSMHDSYTPLGGLVPMFNIMTGEVIFGGVGAGLYGILLYCILAVFIAGLMVGRTPEYLGKKIEQKEVKMAMLAVVATAFSILVFSALSSVIPFPGQGYWNPPGRRHREHEQQRTHGLSEILYAYVSGTGNNGSAFAGITVNTPWYDLTIGLAMWIGRFLFLIPLLAAAGSLAAKKKIPSTAGTFPTHGPLFVGLLVGTVVIVGALTFFPALSLGPIVEHYLMHSGKLFSMILTPLRRLELAMATLTTEPKVTPETPQDDPTSLLPKKLMRARPLFDPEIVRRATAASFVKLNPVTLMKNPVMFVVEVGAAITTVFLIRDAVHGRAGYRVPIPDLAVALVHGPVRELRRSHGGGARQGPGGCLRKTKTDVLAKRLTSAGKIEQVPGSMLRVGDVVVCRRQRSDSRRRRGDRRRRDRRRIGDYRRKRAGHSRIGRRPQRGYWRHAGAVGSNQDQDYFQPRRDVPRSHDRSGRGRPAAEDAE